MRAGSTPAARTMCLNAHTVGMNQKQLEERSLVFTILVGPLPLLLCYWAMLWSLKSGRWGVFAASGAIMLFVGLAALTVRSVFISGHNGSLKQALLSKDARLENFEAEIAAVLCVLVGTLILICGEHAPAICGLFWRRG